MSAEQAPRHRRRRLGSASIRPRDALFAALVLALVAGITFSLLRGAAASRASNDTRVGAYEGVAVSDPRAVPPLALDNYLGAPINIAGYRGRAVLVTFVYTHCPDLCPLITSKLHAALMEMSAAERASLQIIEVSVDPRGDTPRAVAHFLAVHRMTARMQYLIGTAHTLGAAWSAWGIGTAREAGHPDLIEHTALTYGISGRGQIVVVYPSTFRPREIVHDVPLLAAA